MVDTESETNSISKPCVLSTTVSQRLLRSPGAVPKFCCSHIFRPSDLGAEACGLGVMWASKYVGEFSGLERMSQKTSFQENGAQKGGGSDRALKELDCLGPQVRDTRDI